MKKQILLAVAILGLSAGAAHAEALAGSGVLNSVHDMRNAATVGAVDAGGNSRVCAFCHTPHHAQANTSIDDYYPLWSRQIDTTDFSTPYASATIDSTFNADVAIGPTRLCMSCHDGSIAPDQHYGVAGVKTNLTDDTFGHSGVGAGNGLTNDHPVGLNYTLVANGPAVNTDDTAGVGNTAGRDNYIRATGGVAGTLVYKGNANISVQSRLFQGQYMTCATCHDVHNKKNVSSGETANYLVLAPQLDSQLCLTCHVK